MPGIGVDICLDSVVEEVSDCASAMGVIAAATSCAPGRTSSAIMFSATDGILDGGTRVAGTVRRGADIGRCLCWTLVSG